MKILFIKNVSRQGVVGEVKEVAQGFAQHLIKLGQAVVATPQLIEQNKKKIEEAKLKSKGEESYAFDIGKRVDAKIFTLKGGANNKGSLYKALHKKEILEVLNKETIASVPENLLEEVSIKSTGKHELVLKYKNKIIANFTLLVE